MNVNMKTVNMKTKNASGKTILLTWVVHTWVQSPDYIYADSLYLVWGESTTFGIEKNFLECFGRSDVLELHLYCL